MLSIPTKKPKMEWDIKDQFYVKPEFKADINIKIEKVYLTYSINFTCD